MSELASVAVPRISGTRQGVIGGGLAAAIIGGFIALHLSANFLFPLDGAALWLVVPVVLALTWFYVAMFIVAHDCMHGTVVPDWPWINPWIGRLALFLYAGMSFETMKRAHHLHHKHAGTREDPDFDHHEPQAFWPWYLKFFAEYFGFREFTIVFAMTGLYMWGGAPYQNLLVFWALPSVLSSLQLFIFGTYLPHRPSTPAFTDQHRTRSNDYPWLVSLLTCLHFGYHHEHHANPSYPWWRLPELRASVHRKG
jgi:beta-carotene/zeaxanthin 4-ketolase